MNTGQRLAAEMFAFCVATARDAFRPPMTPLRVPIVSPPITDEDGPRACCASYAAVIETNDLRSIWRCSRCGRLFDVPHP